MPSSVPTPMPSLVTILGTAGVAVGLALQGSLANLASGILILFFKQVSKGDFVSSLDKNIEGTVQSIHILYTIIQQPNGPVIIVPPPLENVFLCPHLTLNGFFTINNGIVEVDIDERTRNSWFSVRG